MIIKRNVDSNSSFLGNGTDLEQLVLNTTAKIFVTNSSEALNFTYQPNQNFSEGKTSTEYWLDFLISTETSTRQKINTTSTEPPYYEDELKDQRFEHLFANFSDNYFALFENSNRDDFSDARQAVFFDQTVVQVNGHQQNDFIVQCSFGDKKCNMQDFTEHEDPMYGKCFTFKPRIENFPLCKICIGKISKYFKNRIESMNFNSPRLKVD